MKLQCVFIILFFVAGCASKTQLPKNPRGLLSTEIKANAIKLFTYRIGVQANCKTQGCIIESQRNKKKRRDNSWKKRNNTKEFERFAYLHLEGTLATTGYCREGFIELDRFTFERQLHIRGECNEGASESDYQKFPNSNQ